MWLSIFVMISMYLVISVRSILLFVLLFIHAPNSPNHDFIGRVYFFHFFFLNHVYIDNKETHNETPKIDQKQICAPTANQSVNQLTNRRATIRWFRCDFNKTTTHLQLEWFFYDFILLFALRCGASHSFDVWVSGCWIYLYIGWVYFANRTMLINIQRHDEKKTPPSPF